MNIPNDQFAQTKNRKGHFLYITAILLIVLIGILACAFDIGWIVMTKTQLQAAADSSALAGGTELMPGLGFEPDKTPTEVDVAVRAAAVAYAKKNRAGDKANVFVDSDRDIQTGTARRNPETKRWEFNWGASPYNAVRVVPKRNSEGGANAGPLNLFFAPVLGRDTASLKVYATAVILPAKGFKVPPDSDDTAPLIPFAFERNLWEKYKRARDYFKTQMGSPPDPGLISEDIPDIDGTPLFFKEVPQGNHTIMKQLFDDRWSWDHETESLTAAPDGILELSIFPISQTAGNFGTVDLGSPNNSTQDIKRQIAEGVNENDMSYFPNNEIVATPQNPLTLEGETGISAGIQNNLLSIIGDCRAISLFISVSSPGNNARFVVTDFLGVRFVEVNLRGNNKMIVVQPCKLDDDTTVPDDDDDIGDDTTIFTPLILAQ